MADRALDSSSPANGSPTEPPRESIDQVRDLLFGSQMRMVDARIETLDERLRHETSAMKADFERRMSELDGAMKSEFARHVERLADERATRVKELTSVAAELRQSLESLERRHKGFEEAAGQADAELRDHLLKNAAAFSGDLKSTSERISGELDRITAGLQAEKLDVSSLVSGLTDLASRLGGARAGREKSGT